jgi:hypothetical protein
MDWQSTQILTSIAISSRSATTVYSRSSEKLLQVRNISQASPEMISPADIFYCLENIFGLPNSLNESDNAIRWMTTLLNQYLSSGDLTGAQNYLRCVITFPLLWFQLNGFPGLNLPSSLYVTAALAKSIERSVISRWTAIFFTAAAIMVYLGCIISGLISGLHNYLPLISAFPLMDFGMASAYAEVSDAGKRSEN